MTEKINFTADPRTIPGSVPVNEEREFRYFQDDGKNKFGKQFDLLIDDKKALHATHGGMIEERCRLTAPGGLLFHGISYRGDIEGWRKDIEVGAKIRGILLAWIEGDRFVLSDGRSFPLSECKVEFY